MIKPFILCVFFLSAGMASAQPFPFNGYLIYDYLVSATHPDGCSPDYVTGLPNDSTWVNLNDFSVMTGYFGSSWTDQPGDDFLLEGSFHHHNYIVRLILDGGGFSSPFMVDESMWFDIPNIIWKFVYPNCSFAQTTSLRSLLALDFGLFGIGPGDVVIGVEITFLPTSGACDLAGVYIIVEPCVLVDLGPDIIVCEGETTDIDATTPNVTYLWQDGFTAAVYQDAGPGTYWVEVSYQDCTVRDTVEVSQPPVPPDLGNDTVLCMGQALLLDVSTPGATYHWQNNSTQSFAIASSSGIYAVTVTIANCTFTDQIAVLFTIPPDVDLGIDVILCEDSTLVLDAFAPNATYEWQDQSTSSQYDVTQSGIYSVTVEVGGCSVEDEIDVVYYYPEPFDLGPDVTLCDGGSLLLDVFSPGATYEWQDNFTGSSVTVTEEGIYAVTVTTGGCSISDEIEVYYVPAFQINLGVDTVLCNGNSLLLDASTPNATYSWQNNSSAPTYNATTTGTYFVEVMVDLCIARDSINVTFTNPPPVTLGSDTLLCTGETLILNVHSTGASYLWQDQSTADTLLVIAPGKYWVDIMLNGCKNTDTIDIAYASYPVVDLGNDTTLCNDASLTLDSLSPGATYSWQDNSTNPTYTVTQPGEYWVVASNQTCIITDTIQIGYTITSPITLGQDTTLCVGATLLLDAGATIGTLTWQDQSTGLTFNVTQPGTYWVTAQEGTCSQADTIVVDYLTPLSLNLGPDTSLCSQQNLMLDATYADASYQWQDQSTGPTFNVTQPGNYWVEVSIGACVSSDTIDIGFVVVPQPDLGSDTTLCNGEILVLEAGTIGVNYQWQDQSTDPHYIVTQPGVYAVTVSIGTCEATDTIDITYHTMVTVDLGNDTTLCDGETILLTALSSANSFEWHDQSTQQDFLVTAPGVYFVKASDGLCENADTIQVTYLSVQSISLGNDTLLCADQQLLLQPNAPGAQLVWQDNSSNPTFTVLQPGLYWVQVNNGNCMASDSIIVDVANPVVVDLGADTLLCQGSTLVLDVETPGATFEWNDQSNLPMYLVSQPGIYWVIADVMGCKGVDTISVTFVTLPSTLLGGDTILCPGASLELSAAIQDATYTWQDQSTDSTFVVNQTGSYAVTVTLHDCSMTDAIQVGYLPPVIVDLGADRTICAGETFILDPGLEGDLEYLWQDQSTTQTYVVQDAGDYWLQVTDVCGNRSDTIAVLLENCECPIFFPNVFSPNGDQINDQAIPVSTCEMTISQLKIFDRYGGLLFETGQIGKGWDGETNSKPAPPGVYAYLLVYAFEDGKVHSLIGDVTVIK